MWLKQKEEPLEMTKYTCTSVMGRSVNENHLRMTPGLHPCFLSFPASLLLRRRLSWSPFWRVPRHSHCVSSRPGRDGFSGSTSSASALGCQPSGQSLPLPWPVPSRSPGLAAADEGQCAVPPGGCCSRQQRSALCGAGWRSAAASRAGQTRSGSSGTGCRSPPPAGTGSLFCPWDTRQGRPSSSGPEAPRSSCSAGQSCEAGHSPEIQQGHSCTAPGPSAEGVAGPWGNEAAAVLAGLGSGWTLDSRFSEGILAVHGIYIIQKWFSFSEHREMYFYFLFLVFTCIFSMWPNKMRSGQNINFFNKVSFSSKFQICK